jgi:hypothetical protein
VREYSLYQYQRIERSNTIDNPFDSNVSPPTPMLHVTTETHRSQILDMLFLPGYGAALQMLKVGDGSSVGSYESVYGSYGPHCAVTYCIPCSQCCTYIMLTVMYIYHAHTYIMLTVLHVYRSQLHIHHAHQSAAAACCRSRSDPTRTLPRGRNLHMLAAMLSLRSLTLTVGTSIG